MQEVKHYPHGRSFVAVWHVPARNELFVHLFIIKMDNISPMTKRWMILSQSAIMGIHQCSLNV